MLPEKFELAGTHFIINIAQEENHPVTGLINVSRDPRKSRRAPDCYVGVVEAAGPECKIVQVGHKVVIERWIYSQVDVDDERLIAQERDVLILDDGNPAEGVIAVMLEDQKRRVDLTLPEMGGYQKPKPYYFGKLLVPDTLQIAEDEVVKCGEYVWILRMEHSQYRLGENCLVMRMVDPTCILMKQEKEVKFEVFK